MTLEMFIQHLFNALALFGMALAVSGVYLVGRTK